MISFSIGIVVYLFYKKIFQVDLKYFTLLLYEVFRQKNAVKKNLLVKTVVISRSERQTDRYEHSSVFKGFFFESHGKDTTPHR